MRCIFILAITLVACTKPNPNLCCVDASDCATVGLEEVKGCDDGLLCRGNQCIAEVCETSAECDADAPYCVLLPDGRCQETCTDDIQCPGFGESIEQTFCEAGACVECRASENDCSGATPVCDAGRCTACDRNDDCASGVCIDDGTCANPVDVAYVATSGSASGECLEDSPCSTIELALSKARQFVVVASGTYSRNATITLGGAVRLIGRGASAPIIRRGTDGPIITISGSAAVGLERLEISGATGTANENDTGGHGILCVAGNAATLRLVDANVHGNAFRGFVGGSCGVEALRSRFAENGDTGFVLIDGNAEVDQCTFEANIGSGLKLDAGVYSVTNSFIVRNVRFGLDLFAVGTGNRVEMNTMVDNGSGGVGASGFQCGATANPSFPNNIIARNNIQVTGSGCSFPNSIIMDNDVAPLNFVSPDVAPFDYRIQAGSIAIDDATITTIDHDFDGDPRPASGADVGADEL